jgi:hypothetical protein
MPQGANLRVNPTHGVYCEACLRAYRGEPDLRRLLAEPHGGPSAGAGGGFDPSVEWDETEVVMVGGVPIPTSWPWWMNPQNLADLIEWSRERAGGTAVVAEATEDGEEPLTFVVSEIDPVVLLRGVDGFEREWRALCLERESGVENAGLT